ncbi:hypothetical protein M388_07390 [Mesotoga sp. Brook.08.YT.4.2.5.4.]|nr:hypothetical protein M388_07390 [Mesotoga sp. Brook.08.YT.4.2.5.4.]
MKTQKKNHLFRKQISLNCLKTRLRQKRISYLFAAEYNILYLFEWFLKMFSLRSGMM